MYTGTWSFVLVNVKTPLLGADFLHAPGFKVDHYIVSADTG